MTLGISPCIGAVGNWLLLPHCGGECAFERAAAEEAVRLDCVVDCAKSPHRAEAGGPMGQSNARGVVLLVLVGRHGHHGMDLGFRTYLLGRYLTSPCRHVLQTSTTQRAGTR